MTLRKGWCPTLEHPMESGDGYLVRLTISSGKISAHAAHEVARLSAIYGNGHIDLTSRGNVQIRGVSIDHYAALLEALQALGFKEEARPPRQTSPASLQDIGYDATTKQLILALAFGRIDADALTWLAAQSTQYADGWIYLNNTRLMWLNQVEACNAPTLLAHAAAQGLIVDTHDSRRRIEACPGAPACASACGTTRDLALSIAAAFPDLTHTIHVSGCAKGCACARKTDIVIVADHDDLYHIAYDSTANAASPHTSLDKHAVIEFLTPMKSA